jgi:hypothetical protein
MAVLDFPAAPTMGQVATLTNGFSYQWDGAVWTLTPASPGQVAGGDLTGTYPNPAITAGAVTVSKLAVGATVAVQGQNDNSMPTGTFAANTEAVIASVGPLTYRGGIVLVTADITFTTYFPDDTTCVLRLYEDSTLRSARNLQGGVQTTIGTAGAAVIALLGPTAGSHTISFRWIRAGGTGNYVLRNAHLVAIEFG